MSKVIGFGVRLYNYHFEDDQLAVYLANGIVKADEGKALTWDVTAANTMKLAGDGDPIVARLITVENRVQEGILVGTAALEFSQLLPVKAGLAGGEVVAFGKSLLGAGNGLVKGATYDPTKPYCADVITKDGVTYAVAVYS